MEQLTLPSILAASPAPWRSQVNFDGMRGCRMIDANKCRSAAARDRAHSHRRRAESVAGISLATASAEAPPVTRDTPRLTLMPGQCAGIFVVVVILLLTRQKIAAGNVN